MKAIIIGLLLLVFGAACSAGGRNGAEATASATATAARAITPTTVIAPTATASVSAVPPTSSPTETPAPATSTPVPPTQLPAPPTAPTSGPSAPVTLEVNAQNISFDRQTISVPANAQITVHFTNHDTGVPHDFGVSIPQVAHTATCSGPCDASISFSSGSPGAYTFQCSIHAQMVGTFIVQ